MSRDSQPIVIVKRIQPAADQKKGGVWKIAHADFMTAMMAFFLMMWLVNATDEEIKRSIANYFNPMNLMNSPTDRRGIVTPQQDHQPPTSGPEVGEPEGEVEGVSNSGDSGFHLGGGNREFGNNNRVDSNGLLEVMNGARFNDPLAEQASAAVDVNVDPPQDVDTPATTIGATAASVPTDTMRDPFDPAYWQTTSADPQRTLTPGQQERGPRPPADARIDAADRTPTGPNPMLDQSATSGVSEPVQTPEGGENAFGASDAAGSPSPLADAILAALAPDPAEAATEEGAPQPIKAEPSPAQVAADEIAAALEGVDANVTVAGGERSVLISLTDSDTFSMFPIGSAAPSSAAVDLFGRLAGELAERRGAIVVRGHTDARPFTSGRSDNWMLSFERAHATQRALVRTGVDEARIVRVEGLADREPTNPDDPMADENRRIEVLYVPQ